MPLHRLRKVEGHILVLGCVAVALVLQVCVASRHALRPDMHVAAAAASLLDNGVFADVYAPPSVGKPAPGRSIAPGYPAIVAALAVLDDGMARAVRCVAAGRSACMPGGSFRALLILQALAGIAALALACFLARELSGSAEIAGLATLLTFVMGGFAKLAGAMTPYAITTALALAFCMLLVIAHRRSSIAAAAAAGLTLGALVLFEIYYVALLIVAPLLLAAVELRRRPENRTFALAAATALVLAAGATAAPWMARNYAHFGDVALTQGREALLLAERVAYNNLSRGELLAGLMRWTPGIGDLSGLVLPPATYRKFGAYDEGSMLLQGLGLLAEAHAARGRDGQFIELVRVHILGEPVGHAVSSAILTVRGLGATGGPLVLWGLLVLPILLRRVRAAGDLGPFLLVAGPLLGLTVMQALLTGNLPWMNLPLVFVYAYAIAKVTGGLELPIGLQRWLADKAGGARPVALPALVSRRPEAAPTPLAAGAA